MNRGTSLPRARLSFYVVSAVSVAAGCRVRVLGDLPLPLPPGLTSESLTNPEGHHPLRGRKIDWLGALRVGGRIHLGIGKAWILGLFAQRRIDTGMPVPKHTGALGCRIAVYRISKSPGAKFRPHDPSKPTANAAALTRGGPSFEPTLISGRGRQPDGLWLADGRLCVANAPG